MITVDAYDISAVGSYTLTISNSLPGGVQETYTHEIEITLSSDELERQAQAEQLRQQQEAEEEAQRLREEEEARIAAELAA